MWDEADLPKVVRNCSTLPPGKIIEQVVLSVDTFANGAEQSDDITVTVMKFV